MGNNEPEKPNTNNTSSDDSGHVHNFNRVLGVQGDIYGPDNEKKVIYGCAGCNAQEVR